MTEKILCVDDEPNVLEAYQRALRKEFRIETALGGAEALRAMESRGPYAVIVSDMRMPGMDGVQFLARAKELSPDSVRLMLTGNADQQTAVEAVNEGAIFRFLNKPCPPEALAKSLAAALAQYRLVRAERELLEQTLRGSIKVLTDLLALVNPTAFGRAARVERLVAEIARALKVEDAWRLEIAAMLSQIGCVTIPEETLVKLYHGKSLNLDEVRLLQAHPRVGADLIAHIPRLEAVAEIIAHQETRFHAAGGAAGGQADELSGERLPLGARVLKAALDFDKLTEAGASGFEALAEIRRRQGWYDERVVVALQRVVENVRQYESSKLAVRDLAPHMIVAEDIYSSTGLLLVAKGLEITQSHLARLGNFVERGLIAEPIEVLVPAANHQPPATHHHGHHSVSG
jgi:response regulator RpfG family c-di-GMP phosphodiesterase